MLAGILQSALVWWEPLADWQQILTSNTWLANQQVNIAISIKNTGTESAFFKVTFMGLTANQGVAVPLDPGASTWVYVYPITPESGNYTYNMVLLGDSQVLNTVPIQVTTSIWTLAQTVVGLSVKAPVAEWLLAQTVTGLAIQAQAEWQLAQTVTSLVIQAQAEWVLAQTITGLSVQAQAEWVLAQTVVGLIAAPPGVTPPPVGKGFPLAGVLLLGGGAAIAVLALTKPKKKMEKKIT